MYQHLWTKIFVCLCLVLSLCLLQNSWASTPPSLPQILPPDIALIKQRGELRVAFFKGGAPPFFMQDARGQWSGIEIELAQMIAQQLQVKLVIVPANTFNSIVDLVANGQADIGMGLLNITPERQLRISFTDPYYIFYPHFLVNRLQAAQRGWPLWNVIAEMQATQKSFKLGVLAGGASEELLKDKFPKAQMVSYPSVKAAMDDVVAGKIFAALSNTPLQAAVYLKENAQASLVAEDAEVRAVTYIIGAALPWQYFYLRPWLNIYFDYLQQNGIETQLFEKYDQPIKAGNEFFYPT
jgi:ABC-type amino acid transport substrate-binding protein